MIFYEKEYAEILLESGFSSFMNFEELSLLAKYFKYEGKNNTQIKKSLVNFCIKFCPDFNEVLSRSKIDNAIKNSQKYGIRLEMEINVNHDEIETIKNFGDYKKQKILFVMLVMAKYFKYNNTRLTVKKNNEYSEYFYTNYKFIDILKIAKVNIGKVERMNILYDLEQSGLITTTATGDFKINFICEDSEAEITVDNLDDIISFYPVYCEKCGKIIKNKSKMHNLCEECYDEHRKNSIKINVRKYRQNR
jgi:hypothetical protein